MVKRLPTLGERKRFISEWAYELAQERGFASGRELDDWLQAEHEFDLRVRRRAQPKW